MSVAVHCLVRFLPCATGDDRKPVSLLPRRRLTTAILPIVGSATRTADGGNNIGGGILSKIGGEAHGQNLPRKNKSAMPKIILAIRRQCRQITRMTTPAQYDEAIATAMRTMQPGASFNLTINALRDGRRKAENRLTKQALKALIKAEFAKAQ